MSIQRVKNEEIYEKAQKLTKNCEFRHKFALETHY